MTAGRSRGVAPRFAVLALLLAFSALSAGFPVPRASRLASRLAAAKRSGGRSPSSKRGGGRGRPPKGRGGRGRGGRGGRGTSDEEPEEPPVALESGFGAVKAAPAAFGRLAGPLQLRPTEFSLDERKEFRFLGGFARDLPEDQELPEVAFIGRSNVGKSSFLNALEGGNKNVAIVSKTPGRTRQINLFRVTTLAKDKAVCVFADLPGYGYARMGKGMQRNISRSLRRYFDSRKQLQLAVLLVDARREPQDSDADLAAALEELDVPYVVVATKVDKLKAAERERNLGAIREGLELPENLPIPASVVSGEGVRLVWSIVQGVCASPVTRDISDEPTLEEDRQPEEDSDYAWDEEDGDPFDEEDGVFTRRPDAREDPDDEVVML